MGASPPVRRSSNVSPEYTRADGLLRIAAPDVSLRIAVPGGLRRSARISRVTFLAMDVYNEGFFKNPFRLAKAACSRLPKL